MLDSTVVVLELRLISDISAPHGLSACAMRTGTARREASCACVMRTGTARREASCACVVLVVGSNYIVSTSNKGTHKLTSSICDDI